jgi:hypothetical protein
LQIWLCAHQLTIFIASLMDLCPCSIDCKRLRRNDGVMMPHGWGRIGWAVFAAALVGLTGYMISVGWNQANLIAGVAGFFVAVAGLALAVAGRYQSPVSRELSLPKVSTGTLANQSGLGSKSALAGQSLMLSVPGITFRAPMPWDSFWAVFWLLALAAGGVSAVAYPHRASQIIGWLMIEIGLIGVAEIATGQFGPKAKAIFEVRPKLIVNQVGIYYRWNAQRDIACPWGRIARVTAGARDGRTGDYYESDYLVLVLAVGSGPQQSHPRNVALCLLDEPGFPRDDIRGAIASFAPSILDKSLYRD